MLGSLIERRTVRDPGWNQWAQGADLGPRASNTPAGELVNETTALQLLTVYSCATFIADAISLLPICVYRGTTDGSRTEITPPLWMTRAHKDLPFPEFVNQMVLSWMLHGNAYCIPVRNNAGQVLEVWPIHPNDVAVHRFRPGDRPTYNVYGQPLTSDQIVHMRSHTRPGDIIGMSPIAYMRNAIGSGLAQEEFAGRFFGEGSAPSGIIETPTPLDNAQTGMLREQFELFHRGVKKSHGVAVLSGGASYKPITISPDDAQFLESRNFTAATIAAGIFRLPPEWVGATTLGHSSITYQNVEQRWIDVTRRAFLPSITRLEWMFTNRLLPQPQQAKLDIDEYTRADMFSRFQAYAIATGQKPWMLPEEVRDEEDLPALPAGTFDPAPAPAPVPPAPIPPTGASE